MREIIEPKTKFENYLRSLDRRNFQHKPLQVLSFGGGVQSSAIILLIKDKILPKPDIIVHSDTGSELPETENIVRRFQQISEELGIPFFIVRSHLGKLHEHYLSKQSVPVVGFRSCTDNFKIAPQRRLFRKIVGKGNGKILVNCWLGITTDESHREIQSEVQWITNSFPLLQLNLSRKDCIEINQSHKLTITKSGCFNCPYGGKKWFVNLYNNHPDLFKICVQMEKEYQKKHGKKHGLIPNITDITTLQIPTLFTFGGEIIQPDESKCDSGGCFL